MMCRAGLVVFLLASAVQAKDRAALETTRDEEGKSRTVRRAAAAPQPGVEPMPSCCEVAGQRDRTSRASKLEGTCCELEPSSTSEQSSSLLQPSSPRASSGPRWRLGLGVEAGPGLGDVTTLSGALSTRVGARLGRFALSGQLRLLTGAILRGEGQGTFGAHLGPLGELALGQRFLVGWGPSFDLMALEDCSDCPPSGLGAGAEVRAAYRLPLPDQGRRSNGRRNGLVISLAGHPAWFFEGGFLMGAWLGIGLELY